MERRTFAKLLGVGACSIFVPQFGRFYREGFGRVFHPLQAQLYDALNRPIGSPVSIINGEALWHFNSEASIARVRLIQNREPLSELEWSWGPLNVRCGQNLRLTAGGDDWARWIDESFPA